MAMVAGEAWEAEGWAVAPPVQGAMKGAMPMVVVEAIKEAVEEGVAKDQIRTLWRESCLSAGWTRRPPRRPWWSTASSGEHSPGQVSLAERVCGAGLVSGLKVA